MATPTSQTDLVHVTYDQLKLLAANSLLAATRYYLLTDFAQVALIPGTQNFSTDDVEPLILQATTVSAFSPKAYSTTNGTVVAYYRIDNPDADAAGVANTGFIYHRGDPSVLTDYVLQSEVFNGLTQQTPGLVLDASQGPVITSLVDSARVTYVDVRSASFVATRDSVYAYDGVLYRRLTATATVTAPYTLPTDTANWRREVGPLTTDDLPEGQLNKYANGTLINLVGITENFGNIHAGMNFTGTPQQLAEAMFITYQAPYFNGFALDSSGSYVVVAGTQFPTSVRTFTWGTGNSSNVAPNTVKIGDSTLGTVLADHLANDGTEQINVPGYTLDKNDSKTFVIEAEDTQGNHFTTSISVTGLIYRYFGSSAFTPTKVKAELASGQPIDTNLLSLGYELANSKEKNITVDCTGGKYVYYLYDDAYPAPSIVYAGQNRFSAYTVETVTVTDQFGKQRPYKLLYTGIQYGQAVNVNIVN